MTASAASQDAKSLDPRDDARQLESLFRKIAQRLATGFTGTITLHCHKGGVPRYTVEETLDPRGG